MTASLRIGWLLVAVATGTFGACADPHAAKAAACWEAARDWVQAERLYRVALQLAPSDPHLIISHARALMQVNQPFDALLELEEFLKRRPSSITAAKLFSALCDNVLVDHVRAQEVLEKAVKLSPDDSEAWQTLGSHYLDRGHADEAVRAFQKAAALSPGDALARASLAYSEFQAGDVDRAKTAFAEALRLNQRKPRATVLLLYGDFLLKKGEARESAQYFDRALESDPHLSEAYFLRATAREKTQDWKGAEADAMAAIRESGDRIDAHMLLQRVYRKSDASEQARKEAAKIEELQAAKDQQQATGRALRENLNRAEPLLAKQRFAEAIPYYREIVRLLPRFYEAWYALGVSYAQTGQLTEAEDAFRKYLGYQPLSADGHASYGLLLTGMKRTEEARKELEEALLIDPEFEEAKEALKQLPR